MISFFSELELLREAGSKFIKVMHIQIGLVRSILQ